MKIINNITDKLSDELKEKLEPGSKLSIAAACFSVYAFEELKTQLEGIDALRFIFTSPTFLAEQPEKAQREFYIPRLNREKTLYGSEFEIRLRNEFTQKAISRECAEWVRRKASFKSNVTSELMPGFMTVENAAPCAFAPVNGFTRADLGCERGGNMFSMINEIDAPESAAYLTLFDQLWTDRRKLKDVTDQVLERITTAYRENSPEFLYFFALYNIFSDFLENISEDDLPNEANGFKESQVWNKLYTFQKDAVLAIISKLEQYNGCILADSVGLGKTFTALAVIKYYENRNLRVLVLCPKKLSDNWMTYKANYVNNPIAGDRLRYDVLYHTDLSRTRGFSGELDLSKINWGAYDLVVIDESHNFRNGGDIDDDGKANRYTNLMNKVIRPGARTRVLMLSATPVNNRFYDLRNQLALAYEGNSNAWIDKISSHRTVEEIFRTAQKAFNTWSEWDIELRTTDKLLRMLDFDFFEILDSVTPDAPAGVVFVLKNVHNEVNIDSRNRLHPYYLVYLSEDGVTIHDHLSPKDTLDAMRQLCRGKDKPIEGLYQAFNAETDDGRSMEVYSSLLEDAVLSIVDAKEDSDLDSLFKSGGTSALLSQVSGLDDFQLVCFLVVREEER